MKEDKVRSHQEEGELRASEVAELEVSDFPLKYGIVSVRGAEVQELLDEYVPSLPHRRP